MEYFNCSYDSVSRYCVEHLLHISNVKLAGDS